MSSGYTLQDASLIGLPRKQLRKMGPLVSDATAIVEGLICVGCSDPFKAGQEVALVPVGPGTDVEQMDLAARDQRYRAVAILMHESCAAGKEKIPEVKEETPKEETPEG